MQQQSLKGTLKRGDGDLERKLKNHFEKVVGHN